MFASLRVVVKVGFQKIWEKEDFQNHEHDKKLDQDNQPDLFSPASHFTESVEVKAPDSIQNICVLHKSDIRILILIAF